MVAGVSKMWPSTRTSHGNSRAKNAIEVQASVGAALRPTVLVGFRDLRSRSTYRVFSLTAVWSLESAFSQFKTEKALLDPFTMQ